MGGPIWVSAVPFLSFMQPLKETPFQPIVRHSARDKLIQVAMRFFGERGTSVAMVEIATAAGNRNKSAVAYHFDGKAGLIDAVYGEIRSYLEPRFESLLAELEARPAKKRSLYEVVLALNAPFFSLYGSEPDGNAALKALSRLGTDSHPGTGTLYSGFLVGVFNRFEALITSIAPSKPLGQLKFHLAHYLVATVNGLALTERWQNADFRSNPELLFELMLSYADYVAGGMGGSEATRPPIDEAYWKAALQQ